MQRKAPAAALVQRALARQVPGTSCKPSRRAGSILLSAADAISRHPASIIFLRGSSLPRASAQTKTSESALISTSSMQASRGLAGAGESVFEQGKATEIKALQGQSGAGYTATYSCTRSEGAEECYLQRIILLFGSTFDEFNHYDF